MNQPVVAEQPREFFFPLFQLVFCSEIMAHHHIDGPHLDWRSGYLCLFNIPDVHSYFHTRRLGIAYPWVMRLA